MQPHQVKLERVKRVETELSEEQVVDVSLYSDPDHCSIVTLSEEQVAIGQCFIRFYSDSDHSY